MTNGDEPTGATTTTVVHAELVSDGEGHIALSGEIDHGVAPQLEAALDSLFSAGAGRLVVDFARLSFFDSACISALVRAHTTVTERGGSVKLVNVDRFAYRVLQIAGLVPLFEIERASDAGDGPDD
ncbi:STAS domain-containing protein [Prauserella cavernicola]|uniref:Anti-sigma factor antagonist n=1 Tax=Prauserella cavernicola TaxID=2800127 RepID=A0A934QP29_9PSEU|nr:STAS domain-containing protein [Prauserella cavernicola]MBK1785602.1 STAS domain-containing protein [Prauserella cavernicola]